MDFLKKAFKNVISRTNNELLFFAIGIIVLILFFPGWRIVVSIIGIIGVAFAVICLIIKIKHPK
jgi:hypothetical protein